MNITGTPRYDWDAGYDGIHGFATQLRNRVSDPSTPQRRSSPRQAEVGGTILPKRGSRAPGGGVPPGQKLSPMSGILTRQRDSDTATPSETFDSPLINPLVHLACSFCGNNTHKYTECPVLQQYVRQQANELAAARASGYYPPPTVPKMSRGTFNAGSPSKRGH